MQEGHTLSTKLRTSQWDGRCVRWMKNFMAAFGCSIERTTVSHVAKKLEAFIQTHQNVLRNEVGTQQNYTNCKIILESLLGKHLKNKKCKKCYDACLEILDAKKTSSQKTPQEKAQEKIEHFNSALHTIYFDMETLKKIPKDKLLIEFKADKSVQAIKSQLSTYVSEAIDILESKPHWDMSLIGLLHLAIMVDSQDMLQKLIKKMLALPIDTRNDIIHVAAELAIQYHCIHFFKLFDQSTDPLKPFMAWYQEDHKFDATTITTLWDKIVEHEAFCIANYLVKNKQFHYSFQPILSHLMKKVSVQTFKQFAIGMIKTDPAILNATSLFPEAGKPNWPILCELIYAKQSQLALWMLSFEGHDLECVHKLHPTPLKIAIEQKEEAIAQELIKKDPEGKTWKESGLIFGIIPGDGVIEAIRKMKSQLSIMK